MLKPMPKLKPKPKPSFLRNRNKITIRYEFLQNH